MLTQIELNALHTQMEANHQLIEQLPKITAQLNCIVGSLEAMGSSDAKWQPKEDPTYCMSFQEWVDRLGIEDRRRLMNFLWNNKEWHDTCLREEDFPYDDWSKSHPDTPPEPPKPHFPCDTDEDLPF